MLGRLNAGSKARFYLAAYSSLGLGLVVAELFHGPSHLFSRWPLVLLLTTLLSASLSLDIPLPRFRTSVAFVYPFFLLGILLFQRSFVVPCFLGYLLAEVILRNRPSFLIFLSNSLRLVPVIYAGAFLYEKLFPLEAGVLSDPRWLLLIPVLLLTVFLDTFSLNVYPSLYEGKSPWRFTVRLIDFVDLPFAPLAVPLFLAYRMHGIAVFFLYALPILGGLWCVRWLMQEAVRGRESMDHLNLANELIQHTLNLEEMISKVSQSVQEILKVDGVEIFLKISGAWKLESVRGASPWFDRSPPPEFLNNLDGLLQEEPLVCNESQKEKRFSGYASAGIRSILVLPLFHVREKIGYILCSKKLTGYFFSEYVRFARVLTGQASAAFFGAESHQRLLQTLEELRATQKQLVHSEKMAGLGRLAAGVAHEINNPLLSIILNAESIRKKGDDQEASDLILNAARTCKGIVERLLHFSRQPGGEQTLFDLRVVIEQSLQIWRRQLELENIRVDLALAGSPKVFGKSEELAQVLFNLLANARDAVLEKGGSGGKIEIKAFQDDGKSIVEVTDNGVGIPDHLLPRIFEPFFTTKEVGKGTGLGLSVCYAMVTAMGGTLEARSKPGAGSTFVLTLPASLPLVPESPVLDQALKSLKPR